ncbi:MAG: hypothetical protein ACRELF_03435 [Gemmataceae bacterium]
MTSPESERPDLDRLRGIVAAEILAAIEVASAKLREAGIPHALVGGLAVGAHGYPRTTDDVDFLVGDEAFEKHAGGLVTLKLPLIAIGNVRIDFISLDESRGEKESLRSALESSLTSNQVPIVPLAALVYLKLKAGRQKDRADVVELLKRGRIEVEEIERYLAKHAPVLVRKWEKIKQVAGEEE